MLQVALANEITEIEEEGRELQEAILRNKRECDELRDQLAHEKKLRDELLEKKKLKEMRRNAKRQQDPKTR